MLTQLEPIIRTIIGPNATSVDTDRAFPSAGIKALKEAGYMKLSIPKEFGGMGASPSEIAQVIESIAEVCPSTATVMLMHVTSLTSLIASRSPKSKDCYLRQVLEQNALVTEAISEPGSGSQWWSINSTATRHVTGGYRVSARKSFCTSAGYADLYIVSTRAPMANSDRDHALFILDGKLSGISAGQWNAMGLSGSMSGSIRFDCDVPEESLLYSGSGALRQYNEVNQPLYHLGLAAMYLGIASSAYKRAVDRVSTRKYNVGISTYGDALSMYPIAQRHIGQMYTKLLQIKSAVKYVAEQVTASDSLERIAKDITALKVLACEISVQVTHEAMMTTGGSAYLKNANGGIEQCVRDSLAGSLMGPNDDFCKELIGKLELGVGDYHSL